MLYKNTFLTSLFVTFIFILFPLSNISAQSNENLLSEETFKGLEFRNIGPAFMSGRIADIAIHPENNNIWYVAVGSGGVWKTQNAGTTWEPIFDDQNVYSIGCVTIDKNNPHVIWVGTGENVGGRHVGFGDGIYKSENDGKTWTNMGLKKSEHISKIIIHPENSDVIWVAAQGPLWSIGGERGVFKTVDGGKTWKKTLGDNEYTGATDLLIDSRNPDRLYAATWQHHRNVAAYMGGGPKTGIYRSEDSGETWQELKTGLPEEKMGKIGLAISPQKPDVIYAAIELERRKGGIYKSTNRGASWEKQSDAVSGGTGPHYYQELYACPHTFDRLYLCDVRMQISDDGGKTFRTMKEEHKHSDNHSIAFRLDDPNYLLIGTDGGIYESFDLAENWKFIANLPITQFYKVAVDDAEPFYNIYGGTQDNNTQGGPSRTDNIHGIANSDWKVVLFADGHQPATEPGNPDILYANWQQGNLVRIDVPTGEIIYIQPQAHEGEDAERFNWDAPILVSPHNPATIYHGSQRVWKSTDRGDTWQAISGDLTKNQERIDLPIMDKTWGWDAGWDFYAMSTYNTITSLAESPKKAGLIYAGTDDGLIQVTEDGGTSWRKINVADLPGVPATAFVNDIKADLFDENKVYLALDNHKFGDYKPYLYYSSDKGKSWKTMTGNLPEKNLVWRIVQDHVDADLFFLAAEFGIYFTNDAGKNWMKLSGGIPTISFRDLVIQKRENDLVCASFGRSFYVLDDYSPLRNISQTELSKEAILFQPKKAWWYIQRGVLSFSEDKGSQGGAYFTAPNPPFGAVFTYYLKEEYKTIEKNRKEKEKILHENHQNVTFPGWDKVEAERRQEDPKIWLSIHDLEGNTIKRIKGSTKKGFNRVAWDLTYPHSQALGFNFSEKEPNSEALMVSPGKYTVTLSKEIDGIVTDLSEPMEFDVIQMYEPSLKGTDPAVAEEFRLKVAHMQKKTSAIGISLNLLFKKVDAMSIALSRSKNQPGELDQKLYDLKQDLYKIEEQLRGNQSKNKIGEKTKPTIYSRLSHAYMGIKDSSYGPTPSHKESLDIAAKEYETIKEQLNKIIKEDIPTIEKELEKAGAPWTVGQEIP